MIGSDEDFMKKKNKRQPSKAKKARPETAKPGRPAFLGGDFDTLG